MTSTQMTIPASSQEPVSGYWINVGLSEGLTTRIQELQALLRKQLPNAVWAIPAPALHISFLSLVDPVYDYGRDKHQLFESLKEPAIQTLNQLLHSQPPIPVRFDTVETFPAGIIIKGHDDGSFQRLRRDFLAHVPQPPGTKSAPTIIHATIARFQTTVPLETVQAVVASQSLQYEETVSQFRLVHEKINYMIDYELIRSFSCDFGATAL